MFRKLVSCAALALLVAVPAGAFGQQPAPRQARVVRVAAASDLQFALSEVVKAFETRNRDIRVAVAYGSSGTYHAQILQRAPFDMFLSADMSYPRDLIAKGLASQGGAFLYAIGQIVLWVPNRSPLDVERLGMAALTDGRIRHVAIANPLHAPYGRAAEAALRSAGLLEQVRPKLVFGENVAQAAQFVESGAADIGVIARSLALAPPMRAKGRYWEIPGDAHSVMEQGGVVLKAARDPGAANLLRRFMESAEARTTLTTFGFVLPGN